MAAGPEPGARPRWLRQPRAAARWIPLALATACAPTGTALEDLATARAEGAELRRRLQRSDGLRLLAEARLHADRDPGAALALAYEGATLHPGLPADTVLREVLDVLHEKHALRGHDGPVSSAVFSNSGEHILTTSEDGTARLWTTATARCLQVLEHGDERVLSGSLSPDGRRILTVTSDAWRGTRLWNRRDGALVARLVGASSTAFSPDGRLIAGASRGGGVTLWDAETGAERQTWSGHGGPVVSVRFDPSGARLLSASEDRTARLLTIRGGQLADRALVLAGHGKALSGAAFSPGGSHVLTTSADGAAQLWRSSDGQRGAKLAHDARVLAGRFSATGDLLVTLTDALERGHAPNAVVWDARALRPLFRLEGWHDARLDPGGEILATARRAAADRFSASPAARGPSSDDDVVLWDARSGARVGALRGHAGGVSTVRFHPDGDLILTAGHDGTARLWHRRGGLARRTLGEPSPSHGLAAWSPDGQQVACSSAGGAVTVYDTATTDEMVILDTHEQAITAIDFAADGNRVLTASWDGTAIVWDLETGLEEHILTGHDGPVLCADLSRDGGRALTADGGPNVVLWDASRGERIAELPGHGPGAAWAMFDAAGARVVTCSADGLVRVWAADTGTLRVTLDRGRPSTRGALSPDGARLFTLGKDGVVRGFSTATGGLLSVLLQPNGAAALAVLDAERIVTGGRDGSTLLWKVPTAAANASVVHTWEAGGARVVQVAAGLATRLVATASTDGVVQLFDLDSGAARARLRIPGAGLSSLAFQPAGARLLTTGSRRSLLWPLDAVAEAQRRKPRDLTPAERRRFLLLR